MKVYTFITYSLLCIPILGYNIEIQDDFHTDYKINQIQGDTYDTISPEDAVLLQQLDEELNKLNQIYNISDSHNENITFDINLIPPPQAINNNKIEYAHHRATEFTKQKINDNETEYSDRKAPELIKPSCSALFYRHRQVISHLRRIVNDVDIQFPYFRHPTEFEKEGDPSYIFLREFFVTRNKYQSLLYNLKSHDVLIGFEKMNNLTLDSFVQWLFVQRRLIEKLLPFQRAMRKVYGMNFQDLRKEMYKKDKVYVAD